MKIIGFTNKYYTLWEVSEPYTKRISEYEHCQMQDFTYVQNLSMDFEKAKEKISGKYNVDLSLRGHSSFTRKGEVIDDTPENIFRFGRYVGDDINEVGDIDYIKWYYEQTRNKVAEKVLEDNGFIIHEDEAYTEEEYKNYKNFLKEKDYIDSLQSGHHFEDGEKVELEIKEIDSFAFKGQFGTTHVCTYASKCGKLLKYMGSSPKLIPNDSFVKVVATTKHDNYNGEYETKLQRIKLLLKS